MTTTETQIQKLYELADEYNWDLFVLLVVQLSSQMEDRLQLIPVILHFMDNLPGFFQHDCREVNIFGTQGIYDRGDTLSDFAIDEGCFMRGGELNFRWAQGTYYARH